MGHAVHVGLDVGSTLTKAVAYGPGGCSVATAEVGTSWRTSADGRTESTATELVEGVLTCLHLLLARLGDEVRVVSLGVTGMAESGVLVGAAGLATTPLVAWYDPRGGAEMAALPQRLREEFTATTGLRADGQPSVATLAWGLRHGWEVTASSTWSSVPELVVAALGGERVAEPSLASRTGLLDTARGGPASHVADALGLPTTLLPQLRTAGTAAGTITLGGVDPRLRGAVLTVAGHDHPVAAIGAGATGADELFNGSGTADVLLRSVAAAVPDADRVRLAAAGISVGRHVVDGLHAVLCGVSAGVILRRVLALAGADDHAGRERLDLVAARTPRPVPGVRVQATGRGGDDVQVTVQREATPGELLAAALHHVGDRTAELLALVEDVVGPHASAVSSGGWTRLASVRAVKREVIAHVRFSTVPLPGCRGAAVLGALAADGAQDQHDLPELLSRWDDHRAATDGPRPTPREGAR